MLKRNGQLFQALLAGVMLLTVTSSVAVAFPNPSNPWLSRPGVGTSDEAQQYYAAIGAPATLSEWKAQYGFDGANETQAIYYNASDLGFGREMHCRKTGSGANYTIACYVINHGLGAATPAELALNAAIANQDSLPAVAMVYSRTLDSQANDVAFYIYDSSDGGRLNGVTLDSEGDKFAPQMCLACHAGAYDDVTNAVTGGNFLPFDVASFQYSRQVGYTLADQQEKFRQLNSLVRDTNPTGLIIELIDGWYEATGGVYQAGSTPDPDFVPPGYAAEPDLYGNVFRPYCRSCHMAQSVNTLSTPVQLLALSGYSVFHVFDMPHAELTHHTFWSSPAPAYLANRGGWAYQVTRLDDHAPDGCQPSDCTLREAILAANAGAGPPIYKSIITFGVNGVFTLAISGTDDTANAGDLDLLGETLILGNGADKTIIDGGGLDRVFHVLGGAIVLIQGVTIQNGNTTGQANDYGGGIANDGSQLTLDYSVVWNNAASSGAGIANLNNGITQIHASAIGASNVAAQSGGGINNSGGTVTIQDSTISGNTAQRGGGIYNVNAGSVAELRYTTVTLNHATSTTGGGGVRNIADSSFIVRNSIIAGNQSPGPKDCANSDTLPVIFTSQGYNLFGENGSANGCPVAATDQVLSGPIGAALNINLSAAGPDGTPHHALVQGGPAVDAIPLGGNCSLPSYDQRNVARPEDGNVSGSADCDVGAYEFVPRWFVFLPFVIK